MKTIKIVKRVGACIAFVCALVLSCLYSSALASYSFSGKNPLEIYFSTLLGQTYSSYFFFFFIVAFSFPLIAGLLDKKASSITLSSLSLAFLIPLLIKSIKVMDPYFSMEYEGITLSSATLNPVLLVVIILISILLLSNLLILVCSIFTKDDK